MAEPTKPNRQELSAVFKDQRTLRAFEKVFDLIPSELDAIALESGLASAKANAVEGELSRIASALEVLALAPAKSDPRSYLVDYIDFDATPPHLNTPRRITWNKSDDTLNIHHVDDVTQQVGLETYARVVNQTAATIPNGSVVGFSGAVGGNIKGAKYIADGTFPVDYMIGIATQDITVGGIGRVTVFGLVRNLDTSAFVAGDVIYASSTVAGEFTTTRPSPPAYAVPLGIVVTADAFAGNVFVRPILEETRRFATAFKTTNQTPAVINTAYPITFDSLGLTQGFTIGGVTSRLIASTPGLYNVSASFQLTSSSASVKNVWVWFRVNGTDVANSALKVSLESNSAVTTQHRGMFFSLAASDYLEIVFAADSTNVSLTAVAATGFSPAAPASILTITQVQ